MNGKDESPLETWMGWSNGRWEGDTLVVDVNGLQRSDMVRSPPATSTASICTSSSATRRTGPDHLLYEATIEDPKVFTRPWTMRMPLYRRIEPNAQLLEFKCVEFAEELMYGHLTKKPHSAVEDMPRRGWRRHMRDVCPCMTVQSGGLR